jgi:hypothetical protein
MLTTTLSHVEWVGGPARVSPGFPLKTCGNDGLRKGNLLNAANPSTNTFRVDSVRNLRRGSSIRTSPQQRSHLVVIAKEGNEEFRRPVLKDKTQRSIAPAFKKILA